MGLEAYRLQKENGAGLDGVSYQALVAGANLPVEVRLLGPARADAERWPSIVKRLRLAALLRHAAALEIRELGLDHAPPYVVLEWLDGTNLVGELHERVPLP